MSRPDYTRAREAAGFTWQVKGCEDALRVLAGVPIREFNLSPEACIEAYRKGRRLLLEIFGPDIQLPGLGTPSISYGHANGLGSELLFPEGGEVGHTHIYASLEEGIRRLQQPVDFARAGMAPFYLEFREEMQAAFPGEPVAFNYASEGPVTTAWELRGSGLFTDLYDDPDRTKHFLRLVTESILAFERFRSSVNGEPLFRSTGVGLADDIASMIAPRFWPEFVLPYWEQRYAGLTSGKRTAHVEDLRPAHLRYLEDIGLSEYDPGQSSKLNPRVILSMCRVPFSWRLDAIYYSSMTVLDVQDFVFQTVADGASSVFTYVEGITCQEPEVGKVVAFAEAAKEAKRLLDAGVSRVEVGERVSPGGRRKFWENWPP